MKGLITIKPIAAELHRELKKTHLLNEQFCVIKLGEQSVVSQVSRGTMLKPSWTDLVMLEKSFENMVRIELWNRNPQGQAAMLGYTDIPTALIQENGICNDWFDLINDAYQIGQLNVETEFLPEAKKKEEGEADGEEEEIKMTEIDSKLRMSDKVPIEIDGLSVSKNKGIDFEPSDSKTILRQKSEEMYSSKGIKEKAGKDLGKIKDVESLMNDPHNPQLLKKKPVEDEDDEEMEKFSKVQRFMLDKSRGQNSQSNMMGNYMNFK